MNLFQAARDLLEIPPYHRRLGRLQAGTAPVDWQRVPYGPHTRQYGLLASQSNSDAPVAIYLHGGGWQFGSPELLQAFGAYFYRRGYHVWMPSHRRLPRYGGVAVLRDVVTAARACFGESGILPPATLLPRQVLLAGVSAGGQLAALLALRQNLWRGRDVEVAGLITGAAPLSLAGMGGSPTRERFAGRPRGRLWRALDPVAHLNPPPTFPAVVIHGDRDALVPVDCGRAFVQRAAEIGWSDCDYRELPGGSHLSAAQWIFEGP